MPYADINNVRLHYTVRGEGTPLLFIHPPLLTSACFRYQLAQLSDRFRVIAFDIRGHGLSEASPAPVTYALIAEDIRQLLNHLNIREAVIGGYSTGGGVALEAILNYPDRFSGAVLISAMSEASDFVLRSRIRLAIGLSRWKPLIPLLRWGIAWGNSDSRVTYGNLAKDARMGERRNIRQYYRCSLNYSCTGRLPEIKAPVLLLYGAKDWGFKRYRAKLQESLPQASLVMVDHTKHQLPTKAADEINDAIREWAQIAVPDNSPVGDAVDEARIDIGMPGADANVQAEDMHSQH